MSQFSHFALVHGGALEPRIVKSPTCLLVMLLLALIANPAAAQERQPAPPPEVFTRVTACQPLRDAAQRLACFDREVAALAQAQAAREVVVVDREAVQRTRRGLFGLALPDVSRLFGDGGENEIQARIASAQTDRTGRWLIQLENGAVWVQTEARPLRRDPRPGMPIRIRRGALGSYLANIDEQVAIRVTRQR